MGGLDQPTLAHYFAASDLSILASDREGWANVLLESMACGTPVVATNIWGTPEVVTCSDAGVLVERNVSSIAEGITTLYTHLPDRQATRRHAEQFSWEDTSHLLHQIFTRIVNADTADATAPSAVTSTHKDLAS